MTLASTYVIGKHGTWYGDAFWWLLPFVVIVLLVVIIVHTHNKRKRAQSNGVGQTSGPPAPPRNRS